MRNTWIVLLLFGLAFATPSCNSTPETPSSTTLTPKNLHEWRSRIVPNDDELRWATIPWLYSFAEGLSQAREEKRPLLLWAMNGHPLGCT